MCPGIAKEDGLKKKLKKEQQLRTASPRVAMIGGDGIGWALDVESANLQHTVQYNYESVQRCLLGNVRPLWRQAYDVVCGMPPVSRSAVRGMPGIARVIGRRLWTYLRPRRET